MNLYVPVAPFGGGVTAATSSGVSIGKGMFVFIPAVAFTPSVNAAFIDVRVRVPLMTIVTSPTSPAFIAAGTVMSSVGAAPPPPWQFVLQVSVTPLYGLPE